MVYPYETKELYQPDPSELCKGMFFAHFLKIGISF